MKKPNAATTATIAPFAALTLIPPPASPGVVVEVSAGVSLGAVGSSVGVTTTTETSVKVATPLGPVEVLVVVLVEVVNFLEDKVASSLPEGAVEVVGVPGVEVRPEDVRVVAAGPEVVGGLEVVVLAAL